MHRDFDNGYSYDQNMVKGQDDKFQVFENGAHQREFGIQAKPTRVVFNLRGLSLLDPVGRFNLFRIAGRTQHRANQVLEQRHLK